MVAELGRPTIVLQEGGYHVPTIGGRIQDLAGCVRPRHLDLTVRRWRVRSGGAAAPRPPRPGGAGPGDRAGRLEQGAARRTCSCRRRRRTRPWPRAPPSPGRELGGVLEVGPAGRQRGHDRAAAGRPAWDQHPEVLGLNLPVVLGRHLLDHDPPGRRVAGRDEAGQPAVGQAADPPQLGAGAIHRARRSGGDCRGFGSTAGRRSGSGARRGWMRFVGPAGVRRRGPRRTTPPARPAPPRRPAARGGRPRRGRTPAAAFGPTGGPGWAAPWPRRPGYAPAAPSRSCRA